MSVRRFDLMGLGALEISTGGGEVLLAIPVPNASPMRITVHPDLADSIGRALVGAAGLSSAPIAFDAYDLRELLFDAIPASDDDKREGDAVWDLVHAVTHVQVRRFLGYGGEEDGEIFDRETLVPVAGLTTEQVAKAVLATAERVRTDSIAEQTASTAPEGA